MHDLTVDKYVLNILYKNNYLVFYLEFSVKLDTFYISEVLIRKLFHSWVYGEQKLQLFAFSLATITKAKQSTVVFI